MQASDEGPDAALVAEHVLRLMISVVLLKLNTGN